MDKLLPAELDLLVRIDEKEELRPFFFRKAKSLKWFDPLLDRGYFSPDQHPLARKEGDGYIVPFWPAAEYLASASLALQGAEGWEYQSKLLEVLRGVTLRAKEVNLSNYRTWWCFSKAIRNIPVSILKVEDIALVDYWLSDPIESGLVADQVGDWLYEVLREDRDHNRAIAFELMKSLFCVRFNDVVEFGKSVRRPQLRMSTWHGEKIAAKVASRCGEVLGVPAARVFLDGLESILGEASNDRWSSIWRPSIEPHEQNRGADDPEDVLIDALRLCLRGVVERHVKDGREVVGELLDHNLETFNRIAIWAVKDCYLQLSPLAEKAVEERFFASNYRHELWHLLNARFADLPGPAQSKVAQTIKTIVVVDDDGLETVGATAYRRATWLSAIRQYGFESAYRDCVEIAGAEPEHPDFSSYSWGGVAVHRSSYSVQDLLALKGPDLAALLSEYLGAYVPSRHFDAPDLEGLTRTLRQAVKAEPLRFHMILGDLVHLDTAFVYEIIEGFAELWAEKAQLPWESIWIRLLSFIEQVLRYESFWSGVDSRQDGFVATRRWVVSSVGRLLESGTRSDDHALDESHHDQVERILALMLERQVGDNFVDDSDAVFVAINSPRGQALEALINLSLRRCRLADDDGRSLAWSKCQPYFDAEIERVGAFELAALLPRYLPNFLFMSSSWVYDNFEKIFPIDDHLRWRSAMEGYASVGSVYEGVYLRLRDGGHLKKALCDATLRERVVEKIVQNVVVAYLSGFEELNGELMSMIIAQNEERIHLIWFIWTLRSSDRSDQSRIMKLWSALIPAIDLDAREGRLAASKLASWIDFVEMVADDNRELIMFVAPYVDDGHGGYSFIEALARIALNQPIEAADVWLRMLSRSCGAYPEESLQSALGSIRRAGAEGLRKAKEIASEYARHGNDMPAQFLLASEG